MAFYSGSQKRLKELRVNEAGEIMLENDTSQPVQNRYQELLIRKKASEVTAKEKHLREVAKRLMDAGPSGMFKSQLHSHNFKRQWGLDSLLLIIPGLLNPQTGRSTLRLPKRFSTAHCAALKEQLQNLSCWTKKTGDVSLILIM